jgi:thiol:disulfide interchange protein DsbD
MTHPLVVTFPGNPNTPMPPGHLTFFPEQPNVLATKNNALQLVAHDGHADGTLDLVQNGGRPNRLSGVLVSDEPLQDGRNAVAILSFPVSGAGPVTSNPAPLIPAAPPAVTPAAAPTATLLPVLGFAFLGGLILNLMPCVLPVLSLKVFSLIKHAGDEAGGAWKQGVAFTAGVLVSFWILAGLLIALESAGNHLGWGFQMQSPGFVLALVFLFFLLGLNLFGVFELGTSLVGLDAKATSHLGGLPSSFANGALATLAATPCTAPFMGSAVGFAAQQPAAISLLVFTALALGMAAPYLALTTFPGALRLVPKPGAWMETLKQFMGFLLMGTVIFLVYVFGALTGPDSVPMLLGALLLAAVAAWIFGRASSPLREPVTRIAWTLIALALLVAAIGEGIKLTHDTPPAANASASDGWQPWSPAAVQQALAQGRPVFVDFTAAWCLSCKVNEQVALDVDSTRKLFSDKHVALFRGDWTHSDPQISETLRQFNRNGVPLYLVYSPRNPATPQVLPEVLTPGVVQDALQRLP